MIYGIEKLRGAYRAGKTFRFLFFWGHTPPSDGSVDKSCFSQWWMSPFVVEGTEYSCAEQYMMAEKARLFGDNEMLAAIMQAKHPKEMKAFGRAVSSFDQDLWESQCYEIVKRASLAKFSQNPQLGDYLKSTKNRILVEASPQDRVWGIGLSQADPGVENPMKWRGRNLLGFVLSQVRDELLLKEGEGNESKGNCTGDLANSAARVL
ncbi:NADAR family protein [Paenibacillus mendelii]|uniref:NADAR family protein n=1 Tax=Paenibacillus mendelii TaxID=206163 RepID=A0ABV6JA09_9BACL|nr:NADAR family protein [Paenibacillus mendelii]MCQ6563774.1 NADAR family protein [Paenibacillus mendelii]